MATTTERKSAAERREEVLAVAREVFAEHGLSGASTDDIARKAGISQPYLFRLFRTKKALFIGAVEQCYGETLETFRQAAEGATGEEALLAMGNAYGALIRSNPNRLRLQLQAYAASGDPDVRAASRKGYGELVEFVERASGVPIDQVADFFSRGMLINVIASMDLLDAEDGWAKRLIEGCMYHDH